MWGEIFLSGAKTLDVQLMKLKKTNDLVRHHRTLLRKPIGYIPPPTQIHTSKTEALFGMITMMLHLWSKSRPEHTSAQLQHPEQKEHE